MEQLCNNAEAYCQLIIRLENEKWAKEDPKVRDVFLKARDMAHCIHPLAAPAYKAAVDALMTKIQNRNLDSELDVGPVPQGYPWKVDNLLKNGLNEVQELLEEYGEQFADAALQAKNVEEAKALLEMEYFDEIFANHTMLALQIIKLGLNRYSVTYLCSPLLPSVTKSLQRKIGSNDLRKLSRKSYAKRCITLYQRLGEMNSRGVKRLMYESSVSQSSWISCFGLRKKIMPSVPNLLQANPTRTTATPEEPKEAVTVTIMTATKRNDLTMSPRSTRQIKCAISAKKPAALVSLIPVTMIMNVELRIALEIILERRIHPIVTFKSS